MAIISTVKYTMKRIVFVLSYQEGHHWVAQYPVDSINEFFPQDRYTVVVLDNGNQPCMQEWCQATGNVWVPTENNLGTTGGYNWFIKVGAMLGCERIAVLQADVVFRDSGVLDKLFVGQDNWDRTHFAYYPNVDRTGWSEDKHVPDVGQFFSLNPRFFLEYNYLCDENYTVTHFESTDLWVRMTNKDANPNPAIPINLAQCFYTDPSLTVEQLVKADQEVYYFRHCSSGINEHDPWYTYNFEYFQKKWRYNQTQYSSDIALDMLKQGLQPATEFGNPWGQTDSLGNYLFSQYHKCALDVQRNIAIGQMPYPVEHEVNRFYQEFVKTGICNNW